MTVPVFISCLALVFTVGSFYWLQALKGRLKLYPVMTFSGYRNKSTLVLRIPVILFNSGARPRVITVVRLVTTDDQGTKVVFECHTFRKTINPMGDDVEDMVHAYAIPGRQVVTKHCEFAVQGLPVFNQPGPVSFQLQALVDDRTEWRNLGNLKVHLEIMYTSSYIAYSNNPGVWRAAHREEAAEYRQLLYSAEPMPRNAHGNPVH